MPAFQLIDKLLESPLFQGISKGDLHEIIGHTKFDFSKHQQGKVIARAGEPALGLIFLLNGSMEVVTASANGSFQVTEFLSAPLQLQPERIFGLRQQYSSTFKAHTVCSTMTLSKQEVMKLYNNYDVFRINLLNYYTTNLQRFDDRTWTVHSATLRSHILRFFATHTMRPAGEKFFKIKMTTMAEILNDSRLDISKELNRMQAEGLINLSRGIIHIPALEALFR